MSYLTYYTKNQLTFFNVLNGTSKSVILNSDNFCGKSSLDHHISNCFEKDSILIECWKYGIPELYLFKNNEYKSLPLPQDDGHWLRPVFTNIKDKYLICTSSRFGTKYIVRYAHNGHWDTQKLTHIGCYFSSKVDLYSKSGSLSEDLITYCCLPKMDYGIVKKYSDIWISIEDKFLNVKTLEEKNIFSFIQTPNIHSLDLINQSTIWSCALPGIWNCALPGIFYYFQHYIHADDERWIGKIYISSNFSSHRIKKIFIPKHLAPIEFLYTGDEYVVIKCRSITDMSCHIVIIDTYQPDEECNLKIISLKQHVDAYSLSLIFDMEKYKYDRKNIFDQSLVVPNVLLNIIFEYAYQ